MPMRSRDQSKGFPFITAPQHITKVIKLNVVEFQGNCIVVEEAKSGRRSNVLSKLHHKPHVFNNSSENENTFPRNNFVPRDVTYADATKFVKKSLTGHRQNEIVIFGDSITRRIRLRDFNRELHTGHCQDQNLSRCKFERSFTMFHLH